jgi:hypothetical protein
LALRIVRGLLRLWLVASVLWIGGVGTVAWLGFPLTKPPFDPSQPYETYTGLPSDADPQDRAGAARPSTETPFILPSDAAEVAGRRQAIKNAVEVALIPPALILALGTALGWAIRGFRM